MKIILFLAAVYALIINQTNQKPLPPRVEDTYMSPLERDSRLQAQASSAKYITNKLVPEKKKVTTTMVPIQYSLISDSFFTE